ncbi:SGNH/GDSL hydrolase family protein [Pinisolibacter sp. B13]|uniref:SGNH/GDSL hydrolase family protein n=1 Tax=Pinisolibacter aquiterrae TaxID=2815579 RepID=UPI001C3D1797|nr:SGNH/GDSL hydrolase family protein [Pinisolibacter aquiterrae]MBV5265068.1 SGNH/GDSL hydrolase family protein [Pinisolibacter aquiterrae]
MAYDSFLHIVMCTDSLSFPRPWHAAKETESPEYFFRFRSTYPYLLQTKLKNAFTSSEVQVTNLGQRASTIHLAHLKRLDLVSWFEPSVCILHHGIVDCWLRRTEANLQRCDVTQFEQYLVEILDARDKQAVKPPMIVIGIMPTTKAMLEKEPDQNLEVTKYNDCMRRVLDGRGIFLDVEKMFGAMNEEILHLDGHHLSRLGHKLYADELFNILQKVLK